MASLQTEKQQRFTEKDNKKLGLGNVGRRGLCTILNHFEASTITSEPGLSLPPPSSAPPQTGIAGRKGEQQGREGRKEEDTTATERRAAVLRSLHLYLHRALAAKVRLAVLRGATHPPQVLVWLPGHHGLQDGHRGGFCAPRTPCSKY